MLSSVLFTDIISVILFHTDSAMAICFNYHCTVNVNFAFEMLQKTYWINLANEQLAVFTGLNQVSAGLNRFKPQVWQKPNPALKS